MSEPVAQYGITSVSPPDAARILGRSCPAIERLIEAGLLTATGVRKRQIPLSQIERLRSRPVTVTEYFHAVTHRRQSPLPAIEAPRFVLDTPRSQDVTKNGTPRPDHR